MKYLKYKTPLDNDFASRLDERKGVLQEINGMQDLKVRAVDQLLDQARDHDKGQGRSTVVEYYRIETEQDFVLL